MHRLTLPFLMLLLLSLACGSSSLPSLVGGSTPVPTPVPIPPDELVAYRVPLYTVALQPGTTVPGTFMEYVGRSGEFYQVKIDGLVTNKRAGDSFTWRGVRAPSVYAVYNLRLATEIFGGLTAAGAVEVMVFNPRPTTLPPTALPTRPPDYNNIPISFTVPRGEIIPGTTLQFINVVDNQAQIGGRAGYPYVAVADSLDWLGTLRENVTVRYSLRVIRIDPEFIRVDGTMEMWLTEWHELQLSPR
ncbi:MAG: hypothetical protein KJ063_05615 [Anaerolineae bacterium]|nr:hypothetical protein [Anaerolineae bacterium]